jgi:hypothetical protein
MTLTKGIYKKREGTHNAKPVIYEGETYSSLEKLAKHLKTSPQLLRYYLKRDKPFGGSWIDYAL